jgi:hypothetical protein
MVKVLALAVLLAGWLNATPTRADINVGITIGTPPPPPAVVVAAPPQVVVVPGTSVYYAPGVSFNLFVYSGRYYSLHNGVWFVAAAPGAPWVVIAAGKVPQPVLAVPAGYYRIPPGQAKKLSGEHPGKGHGPGKKKWKHD